MIALDDKVNFINILRQYNLLVLIQFFVEGSYIAPGIVYNLVPALDRHTLDTQTTTYTDIGIEEVGTFSTYRCGCLELQVHVVSPSELSHVEVEVT